MVVVVCAAYGCLHFTALLENKKRKKNKKKAHTHKLVLAKANATLCCERVAATKLELRNVM